MGIQGRLIDNGMRQRKPTFITLTYIADIGGALGAGLRAVLVRTGKYREDFAAASGIEPTATVDSIADVPGLLSLHP